MFAWSIFKGSATLVGALALATIATDKAVNVISEDTPITLKSACIVGTAILTIAIWINRKLSDASRSAKEAAKHAEAANETAVRNATTLQAAVDGLKEQIGNLPCHPFDSGKCPPARAGKPIIHPKQS